MGNRYKGTDNWQTVGNPQSVIRIFLAFRYVFESLRGFYMLNSIIKTLIFAPQS